METLPDASRGSTGRSRLHRDVLQQLATTFNAGLHQSQRL